MTIIWVNGTFGAGKTTTAGKLVELTEGTRLFDPEYVGYMLSANLKDQQFTDFQQLPPWRTLVPVVMDEVARFTGQHLVAVQTVLVEDYWREISTALHALGHPVIHVLLDADAETLHTRIDADPEGQDIRPWRHDHVDEYQSARTWLLPTADLVIDTTKHPANSAATQIKEAVAL
ncbi:ATP-binding protein [Kribbella pittospori]|uniref:ATP-binding protein n=1 Tax=Kribbella pittospori TaxID=722689 RepID=A0A4R0KA40_9ACTN|nr:AAA family ATPase [Kribbella pittospori]TCC55854.1 ATP-binding protein [Kribbella pittospori]